MKSHLGLDLNWDIERQLGHAKHAPPCRDAIQFAQRAVKAAKYRQRRQMRGDIALLGHKIAADLAQRFRPGC